jgi:hypothetical protein
MPHLIMLSHLHVGMTQQPLYVFLCETLLLVQPGVECTDLVKGGGSAAGNSS